MLQSGVFLPTPHLAKECSDILFRSPHPWLTLDDESKELNSSHVGAPSASGLHGYLPLEEILIVILGPDLFFWLSLADECMLVTLHCPGRRWPGSCTLVAGESGDH